MPMLLTAATGAAGFVEAVTDSTTGITSGNLWNEVTLFAGLITTIFVFAFGFRVAKKVLKSGSKGKINM